MAEYDRSRYTKKKFHQARDFSNAFGKNFTSNRSDSTSKKTAESTPKKQPTILIKTREPINHDDAAAKPQKEEVKGNIASGKDNEGSPNITSRQMTKSLKLIDENVVCTEALQEYFQDNTEFLVVGIVGSQSVGKSTVANMLIYNELTKAIQKSLFENTKFSESNDSDEMLKLLTNKLKNIDIEKDRNERASKVFNIENDTDIKNGCHRTQGIDIFVTNNRLILLDCQPFVSLSVLEDLMKYENKRNNMVSEFIPLESSGEVQGLQLAAFLMSVCHVLILVQDTFFDSNIIRFIQSAEMLKPTIPNTEEEVSDHFPHLLLVQNKAQMSDFAPSSFKIMQQTYRTLFEKTKMNTESGLGLGTGRLIHYLNAENCGSPINLFLLPEVDLDSNTTFSGFPQLSDLVKRLRTNVLGSTRNALTHVQLTEKTWLIYCSKVWETVKKSPFFVEYMKLMP